ncbi:response regulator [Chitinophagaceae bacterium LWZ2-11]
MENPKTKILVIEDEQYIRENIQELLQARGYEVHIAANGEEGVTEAASFKPNLIVCDIMMPKMDGYKVLENIRKTSLTQNIPFIFLTAKADKNDIRQGMELGADDFISKPFTTKELTNAIESRLDRYQKINSQYSKIKHQLEANVFTTYYHEFNTPLHGIIGGLNLLINAGSAFSDSQVHDLHQSILKSAVRLNHSLANLMLYEEIKRADGHEDLLKIFSTGETQNGWPQKIKDELYGRVLEVYGRLDDLTVDLAPAILRINKEYLTRIIVEITDNAFKFSKSGQKVEVTGDVSGNNYKIIIKDKGSGFELSTVTDIAPFKQFNRRKLEQQGLGIGLYLVKQLIEFNKGSISLNTNQDMGTIVTIQIPLADSVSK